MADAPAASSAKSASASVGGAPKGGKGTTTTKTSAWLKAQPAVVGEAVAGAQGEDGKGAGEAGGRLLAVQLHVYDITNSANETTNNAIQRLNGVTRDIGFGGIFHGGLEVLGSEWSFGFCESGSGVYAVAPKTNPMYTFRETVPLGVTAMPPERVHMILRRLRDRWPGTSYDLLKHNCVHFCEALCNELGAGPFPQWVNRFARGADATVTATGQVYDAVSFAAREATVFAQTSWDLIAKSMFDQPPPSSNGASNGRADTASNARR